MSCGSQHWPKINSSDRWGRNYQPIHVQTFSKIKFWYTLAPNCLRKQWKRWSCQTQFSCIRCCRDNEGNPWESLNGILVKQALVNVYRRVTAETTKLYRSPKGTKTAIAQLGTWKYLSSLTLLRSGEIMRKVLGKDSIPTVGKWIMSHKV